MLRELLYRDWILHRKVVLISFAIFGAFQFYLTLRASSTRSWLVILSIYVSFLAVSMFVREDRFRATAWTCTLPITRRELVRARYVECWILILGGLVFALLTALLLPTSIVTAGELAKPATLLISATAITVVLTALQPFTIRFGFAGIMIFLVGMQILGIGLLTLARLLGGKGLVGGVAGLSATISHNVIAVRDALSSASFALLVVLTLVLVNWAGYRLAVFLFSRREL